jgi:lactococcin 972 family bacteriocin
MSNRIFWMMIFATSMKLLGGCADMEQLDPAEETAAASSDLDATETSGFVELSSDTPEVRPNTVKNVGGGTWNYGRSSGHCWSHYVHPARKHSATAVLGPTNRKRYASAGTWANSDIYGGLTNTSTCYAYWNTY